MKVSDRRKIKSSITIISIGVIAGFMYPLMSRELYDPFKVLNGIIIGLLGSGFLVFNEIWLRRMVIRRLKFSYLILLKSLQYSTFFVFLITLVISLDRSRRFNMSLVEYWQSQEFAKLVWQEDFFIIITYALAVTVIFILVYLISRKMGQGVLWNFVIGKYHRPSAQTRIFMNIDLKNSTSIAERLGDVKYHLLLNEFFYDITDSIVLNYGRIYRYIGDEVIVSWNLRSGLKNSNFINTYLSAKEQIRNKAEEYRSKYGIVPDFSAAVHYGEVVIGELGEVKSEISYIGEVMHQTSSIEKACTEYSSELLISKELYEQLSENENLIFKGKRNVEVKGSEPVEVVELAVA
jgi:adenylate cyclase